MTPEEYCQQEVIRSGSSFYYSFLFLKPKQKNAIMAVYAFCRTVDDIVDDLSDHGVARVKLHWWREEISRLYDKNPQHPISKALLPVLQDYDLSKQHFIDIIDGVETDLNQQSFKDFAELTLYCERVASAVGLLAVEIFGYQDAKTLEYAKNLGICLQLINIIRDVGEDAARGRIYLPQNELEQFNVVPEKLLTLNQPDSFSDLMKFQSQRAREYYQKALEILPNNDRANQRAGLIMAKIYLQLLDEIEQDNFQVLTHRLSLSPLHKLWVAWRTYRHEKKNFKQTA